MISLESNNVMVDLETMGTTPDAPIISIGAVIFDNTQIIDGFYVNVDLKSSVEGGAIISPDTVMWWMKQSDGARNMLGKQTAHINEALVRFADWLPEDVKLWGNGVDFDNAILKSAYDRAHIALPWKFYNNRCYRTIKNLYPDVPFERTGAHHDAFHDAKSQALHLIRIMSHG